MLTLLIDHNSLDKARRALLVSAAATIYMASTKVFGGTLTIAGLEIEIDREHLLTSARILTAYFLYVFIWFSFSHYSEAIIKEIHKSAIRSISQSLSQAKEVDNDLVRESQSEYQADPDPWWEYHIKNEIKMNKTIGQLNVGRRAIFFGRTIATHFFPASFFGVCAVFYPEQIAGLLYR